MNKIELNYDTWQYIPNNVKKSIRDTFADYILVETPIFKRIRTLFRKHKGYN